MQENNVTAAPEASAPEGDVQAAFIGRLLENKTPVSAYLVNGIKLVGRITAADRYTLILESGAGRQLVYKHAISTVLPDTEVSAAKPARDPARRITLSPRRVPDAPT